MHRRSSKGQHSRERLKQAAIRLFFDRGYHAATIRQVAARARLDPASVYYYFPSKQALLATILEEVMEGLIAAIEAAVALAGPAPDDRLRAAIRTNVMFHGRHPREAAISDTELRGLTPRNRARIILLRDRLEEVFRTILAQGNLEGCWSTDPRLACFSIMAVCNEVSHWYRPDGGLALEAIAAFDADFLVGAVRSGQPAAAAARGRRRAATTHGEHR